MGDPAAVEFLTKYKLNHLIDPFKDAGADRELFCYLRNNIVELMKLVPVLRDRATFCDAVDKEDASRSSSTNTEAISSTVLARSTLQEICMSYDEGKTFWDQKNIKFEKTERELLAPILVRHFLKIGCGKINKQMFDEMFEIIRTQFPTELKPVWYVPGTHPKGLLFRYYQALRPKKAKGAKIRLTTTPYNRHSDIYEAWDESYPLRRYEAMGGTLNLNAYLILNNFAKANDLITRDFIRINERAKDIATNLPLFIKKFKKIFDEYRALMKEDQPLCDEIVKTFCNDPPINDNTIFLVFYSLPLLLRENFVFQGPKRWRPTLYMSRTAYITIIPTEATIAETIEKKRTNALARKVTVQPFILAIGSIQSINKYFVVFDDLLLPCSKPVEAFDIHFKLHDCFNLQYAGECGGVLYFIQKFFFALEYDEDKIRPDVEALIGDILKS